MTERVFVSAWVGVDNRGDELLFERLRIRLCDLGASDVTVTSLSPAETARLHGVRAVHPRHIPAVFAAIRRADLFVLGPGGLLQDASSPWNLPYQMHRALLARMVRTPIVGIGLGAEPLRRRLSGPIVRAALGRAEFVAVRDEASRTALATVGLDPIATADLAVAAPTPDGTIDDAIVVSLRPRPRSGVLPVAWRRRPLEESQIECSAAALDQVSAMLDLPVRFVAFEPHTDDPLHQAVAARMRRPATCTAVQHHELLDEMRRSRLVIATRYHAGITALVADRPAVLIGYAPKVRSLASALEGIYPLLPESDAGLADLPTAVPLALDAAPVARAGALADLRAAEARHVGLLGTALRRR